MLLARHGKSHSVMPSNVNYRANISALKILECTHVVATTATGKILCLIADFKTNNISHYIQDH